MSGAEIVTLGCRLNVAESEAMRAALAGRDDLVIVNTCAVTAEAVREAGKAVRRAARRRPDARIVVTGCAAELEPHAFAAMPGVAAVVANERKRGIADLFPPLRTGAPIAARPPASRTRAFVEVQNGCDHRCTFCIIPFARGPARSVPAGVVVEQIRAAVAAGCNEAVLTGVDLTSYGADLHGAPTLGQLVERVLRLVPNLPRLRLSSLDAVEIDERLFTLLAGEPRVQPHLHLSLQHGDDLILKRMRRRHSRAQAIALVQRLKAARPEIAIGADLIAGFPTESEAAAQATLAILDECDIVFGHVFPFSPRAGTPAARMPQLDPALVRARARRLREAADARRRRWLATLVGTEQRLLVEGGGRGHVESYAKGRLLSALPTSRGARAGEIVTMRVTHIEGDTLVGDPV